MNHKEASQCSRERITVSFPLSTSLPYSWLFSQVKSRYFTLCPVWVRGNSIFRRDQSKSTYVFLFIFPCRLLQVICISFWWVSFRADSSWFSKCVDAGLQHNHDALGNKYQKPKAKSPFYVLNLVSVLLSGLKHNSQTKREGLMSVAFCCKMTWI